VAGGAGYIGTHTILCLLVSGFDVTVVDNLMNSSEEGLNRVKEISGCDPARLQFFDCDVGLEEVLKITTFQCMYSFRWIIAIRKTVALLMLYYMSIKVKQALQSGKQWT
jgi:UDP-glucose 4-epimerase